MLVKLFRSIFKRREKKHYTGGGEVRIDDLHPVIRKMQKGENLTSTDMGILFSDFYDKEAPKGLTFKLNEVLVKDSVFKIDYVHSELYEGKTVITLRLHEMTFGLEMNLVVTPENFDEIFVPFTFKDKLNENTSTELS